MRDKLNAVGFTQRCDLEDLGHSAGLSNIRYQGQQPRIDHIAAGREGLTTTDGEPNQSTSGDELIEQKQLLCRCERAGKPLSRAKYAGPMHCVDPKTLGLATQWSFWAMLEMEALLLDLLQHRAVLPELARDASYAERCSNTKRTSAFADGRHPSARWRNPDEHSLASCPIAHSAVGRSRQFPCRELQKIPEAEANVASG